MKYGLTPDEALQQSLERVHEFANAEYKQGWIDALDYAAYLVETVTRIVFDEEAVESHTRNAISLALRAKIKELRDGK